MVNVDNYEIIPGNAAFLEAPILPVPEERREAVSQWEKFKETSLKVAKFCEEVLWKYIKEAGNISKRIIKAVVVACSEISKNLSSAISKIGILSGISALLALKETYSSGTSLADAIRLNDVEGIIWSSLGLIFNPLEALDSIITATEAIVAFGEFPAVAVFGLIALPIGITLSGFGAIKGLYDLIQNSIYFHEIPKALNSENLAHYKAYLKSKIGVTKEEKQALDRDLAQQKNTLSHTDFETLKNKEIQIIKDRKRNILSRHANAKVYNIMTHVLKGLKEAHPDMNTLNLCVDDMKTIMARKIAWGSVNSLVNVAFTATLVASAIFPISGLAIPIIGGTRALVQVGKHHYDHVWLHHGLNLPAFADEGAK